MKKYKVIRTYEDGRAEERELQKVFDEGYEFVRASEYIEESVWNGVRRYGYIEYIVMKEEVEK